MSPAQRETLRLPWDNRPMNEVGLETVWQGSRGRVPDWPGRALLAIAFIAAYVGLDWVSYIHPMQKYTITPWNPQPALAVALLMLAGQRWILLVFAAVLAAEILVRGAPGPWGSTLLVCAVLGLGYAAIARALAGPFTIDPALASQGDAVRLVGVVSGGALLTGVLYIAALLATGQGPLEDPFSALVRFWIGDAIGILVTLPIVLMASVGSRRAQIARLLSGPEALVHAAFIGGALTLVFSVSGAEQVRFFYVLFLPLIVVATRHGLAGSTVAMIAIQGGVIVAGQLADLGTLTVFELQSLLIALTITGLFLGVTVDERRRAQAELARSLRLASAGEMAAALAHELNQPLTAVASYARASQLLARTPQQDRELLGRTLARLVAESDRAADVVRRLRDFFLTGSTRLSTTDIGVLATRAVAALAARASEAGVRVASNAAALPPILADELQVEVVLKNLLANAIEAARSSPTREVALSASAAHGHVEITVTDSGPGVATADAVRIFEPFETTRATGMGMGLAISRAIVEAHGGRLWVEPGERGVFRLTLPMHEEVGHG
jgi:signal transduction histidine kinase